MILVKIWNKMLVILGYIKYYFYKIVYFNKNNIKFDKKNSFPLSLVLDIDKKSNFSLGKIWVGAGNRVSLRIREGAEVKIGNDVCFNDGCILTCRNKIYIGNNVMFGPNVMIFDHDHDYKNNFYMNSYITGEIIIEDGVWIGANSVILKGSIIKKNSVIGAGSIVNGVVEENILYYNERIEKKRSFKRI